MKYKRSPMVYIGNKYKLLPQILPLFPKNIDVFIDIFGGGADVSINVEANKKIYNDKCWQVTSLLHAIKTNPNFKKDVEDFIAKWRLSKTDKKAYDDLRTLYNINCEEVSYKQSILFFLLICYSFNHMIQFNKKQEFNVPFGKDRSSYNKNTEKNLEIFQLALQDISIECMDYKDLIQGYLSMPFPDRMFFYCDSDYSITDSSYNRCADLKWTEQDDLELFNKLDYIDSKGALFAMSNVLECNGKENINLKNWLAKRKYVCYNLDMSYNNSNYQRKNKGITKEVLIVNY